MTLQEWIKSKGGSPKDLTDKAIMGIAETIKLLRDLGLDPMHYELREVKEMGNLVWMHNRGRGGSFPHRQLIEMYGFPPCDKDACCNPQFSGVEAPESRYESAGERVETNLAY